MHTSKALLCILHTFESVGAVSYLAIYLLYLGTMIKEPNQQVRSIEQWWWMLQR